MKNNEKILDSGEIYKDLNPLEISIEKDEPLDWSKVSTRVNAGGRWWKSHHLISLNKNTLWFVPAFSVVLLGVVFLLLSAFLSVFVFLLGEEFFLTNRWGLWIPLLFILIFVVLTFAISMDYFLMHPIAKFHKTNGLYRKKKAVITKLEDITAIQLLREQVQNDDHKFFSYEINLVLKDGNRVNVVDHGNEKAVIQQARRLAKFLDVELLVAKDIKG